MQYIVLLSTLTFLLFHVVASAQGTYAPDRPGKAIPTAILSEGYVSLEAGCAWQRSEFTPRAPESFQPEETIYSHNKWLLPGGLLRIGLGERFEVRVASTYTRWDWRYDPDYFDGDSVDDPEREGSDPGVTPLVVSIKTALTEERGWIPRSVLVAGLTVPLTGTPAYQVSYLAPDFALAFSHSLTSSLSLGYHIGAKWDGEFVMPIGYYAVAVGFGLSEKLAAFVEAFGDMPGYAPPQHGLDAGIAWAVGEHLQLDAAAGLGINAPEEDSSNPRWLSVYATDYFVELGVSWRLRLW
jgi:hypothetical protein